MDPSPIFSVLVPLFFEVGFKDVKVRFTNLMFVLHKFQIEMTQVFANQEVFLRKSETYWDLPFPMKRHHLPKSKSVILRATVSEINGKEFKAVLHDNNGFERDGEAYVFHVNDLLTDQNFLGFEKLGKWENDEWPGLS